ncbi:GNAT family N-acetyltransferase [Streptomyces colonosanans]|uniref:GNAT family N-acetyltransferase n=1 Tax=Streptomyces colonosanans TaxID=1428652 RepID=A0A1S2P4L1_9ACTN|nr:GNAT family N-acetyltransferase [Streptomyces colonosanans]OIJ88442.1 GNAT family N-acetyltransferase [Streptomyces colonosanans]
MNDTLRIRDMTPDDCRRVSEIRINGWRTAYRGLIPQSYLDALDVDADTARRRARLAQGDGVVNLVADRDGEVVGWAAHGPYRDGEALTEDAELYAIYVSPQVLGAGAGRALLAESTRRCTAAGHERMLLWVLRENTRARRFYERAGFHADGTEETFEADGAAVPEVRYAADLPLPG